jgi:DNA-binding transcriptional regulator YiaG
MRALRKVKDNQTVIARHCGVAQGRVSDWKNGVFKPSLANRQVLFARYGIPLFSWDEPAQSAAA